MTSAPGRQVLRTATPAQRRLHMRLIIGALAGLVIAVPVVVAALLVRSNWMPLRRLDLAVANDLNAFALDHSRYVDLLKFGAIALDPWVYRVAALILVVVLLRRGAHRLAWWAAVTTIAGGLAGVLLKFIVGRARPTFADAVVTAPSSSFPSGHALNSAVVTAVILLAILPALPRVRWRVAAVVTGAALVAATGYDRIGLGVHYLSDVLAAWCTATAIVVATTIAFETWQRHEGAPVGDVLHGIDPDESERLT